MWRDVQVLVAQSLFTSTWQLLKVLLGCQAPLDNVDFVDIPGQRDFMVIEVLRGRRATRGSPAPPACPAWQAREEIPV